MVRIGGFFQNGQSHSTSPSPRPVHLAVANWRDHLWQVHHGALSLDVHLLPIIGPPLHDDEKLEATPKDERWGHLWQVHATALSVDVPILPGETQMDDHDEPTPKRYKKERPLNTFAIIVDWGLKKPCRPICLMFLMWITGTKPHRTWRFNPPGQARNPSRFLSLARTIITISTNSGFKSKCA